MRKTLKSDSKFMDFKFAPNRVAGGFSPPAPTPPHKRVRIGRFIKITVFYYIPNGNRSRVMNFHPLFFNRYRKTLKSDSKTPVQPDINPCSPFIGHARLRSNGPGKMPRPFTANRCHDGLSFKSSQFEKIADFCAGIAPLFPVTHPHSAAEPFV